MTFTELKKEVAALGFENRLYQDGRLVIFASRAQKTIFSDRAVTRTIKIYVPPTRAGVKLEGIKHIGGATEVLELIGKAYSIELCGSGTASINDGGAIRTECFDSDRFVIKGFISSGGATLTLTGEHAFFVTRLVTFPETYSDDAERIPDADGRIINRQAAEMGDFLCFTGLPADKNGALAECICMEDGAVTFPEGTEGEFFLTYRRAPRPINPDSPLEAIDVPKESEHLLTLLTASYLCLECDSEQAELYRSVYEQEMRELNKSTSARISAAYHDVTGWA